jgi:hypothetical protein
MANCQPLACRNTALTPVNLQALNGHLTELEQTLTDGDRLAPGVVAKGAAQLYLPGPTPGPRSVTVLGECEPP